MDGRSPLERFLWNTIGEPLYYCEECLRCVHVKEKDGVVTVKKNCEHNEAKILAPRKSYLSGSGFAGLSTGNKMKATYQQVMAKITGRNV